MEVGTAILVAAFFIWLLCSKEGCALIGLGAILLICIAFPPMLFVFLILQWMRADANRPAQIDYELAYAQRFYPNAYRHPFGNRIILEP